MATNINQAIQALSTQRDLQNAEDPVDRAKVRRTVRLLRVLQVQAGVRDPADADADIRAAFVGIRDTEQNPSLFVQEEWLEDATLLMQQLSTMPPDDQDQRYAADNRLIRQDQVRALLMRTERNAATEFDPIRDRCVDWLERFFDTYLNDRPIEAEFAATLGALEGGALDAATLASTLSALENNAGRLQPRAEA